jgi:hypothetical protein
MAQDQRGPAPAFNPFLPPARTGEAPAAAAPALRRRGRPRCPDCDSTWVGFLVPPRAVVVQEDGELVRVTIADEITGRFFDIDDVCLASAICLDCRKRFDAGAQR